MLDEEGLDEPSVLLLFRKLIEVASPGLQVMKLSSSVTFPSFERFAHKMLERNRVWIWLCYLHLELFIHPEKDICDLLETALLSVSDDTTDLWIFYIQSVASKSDYATLFRVIQRFIAAHPRSAHVVTILRIFVARLSATNARDLVDSLRIGPTRQIGVFCASVLWQNEQFVKCSETLKNLIDANNADQFVFKFFIAGQPSFFIKNGVLQPCLSR